MLHKTILVTGANGLLGQKLIDRLCRRPAIQLFATGKGPNRNPNDDGYTYVELDITDAAQVLDVFQKVRPTEVIHSAAMTHVDQCELDPDKCWELNVTAVQHVVDACRAVGAKVIHVSTDFIFDGLSGPYSERDQPNPLSHYGRSKLASEQIVVECGLPFAIARTMLVYGVVADMSRSNIVLWAKKALEEGKEIQVVNDQFRSPTLAEDLADGIIQLIMREKNGIYNISGPETMSILDMVHMVAKHYELDATLIRPVDSASLNQPAKRPAKTGFIILKAQTELAFKPRTVREGLALLDKQLQLYGGTSPLS
jgi:dTDP-4-dehydrorhamnose reductase